DAVIADDVPRAGQLNPARVFDPLRPRPDRRAFDDVVADEVIVDRVLGVLAGGDAEIDIVDVTTSDDDSLGFVADDGVPGVADGQVLEPDIVQAGGFDRALGLLSVDDRFPVARAAPDDRLSALAALADLDRA